MEITRGLIDRWADREDGRSWLARVPTLKSAAAARWDLEIGPMFPGSNVSFVWPATRTDGSGVVLKVNFPEEDTEHEADALHDWQGRGAVRLIDHHRHDRALLIERIVPGTFLEQAGEAEIAIGATILRDLHVPLPAGSTYRRLDVVARGWQQAFRAACRTQADGELASLFGRAISLVDELAGTADRAVLLHQDLHVGNILRDEVRDGWLAIDPKPLVGDPAFDAASLIRIRRLLRLPDACQEIRWSIDELADHLGYDRERMVGWGVVHAMAWSEGGRDAERVRFARLIAEAGAT